MKPHKYQKRSNDIYADYEYYVRKEGLFHKAFRGHKKVGSEKSKLLYIWSQLEKQHRETDPEMTE